MRRDEMTKITHTFPQRRSLLGRNGFRRSVLNLDGPDPDPDALAFKEANLAPPGLAGVACDSRLTGRISKSSSADSFRGRRLSAFFQKGCGEPAPERAGRPPNFVPKRASRLPKPRLS